MLKRLLLLSMLVSIGSVFAMEKPSFMERARERVSRWASGLTGPSKERVELVAGYLDRLQQMPSMWPTSPEEQNEVLNIIGKDFAEKFRQADSNTLYDIINLVNLFEKNKYVMESSGLKWDKKAKVLDKGIEKLQSQTSTPKAKL